MPDPNTHITNLESDELILGNLKKAQSAHMADPTDDNAAAYNLAIARHSLHKKTHELLEAEFGPVVIGAPKKTKWKSSLLLAQQGYVGIYRRA